MIPVQKGNPMPLTTNLADGNSNVFVRAYLYDTNQNQLPSSPVDLLPTGSGLYTNATIPFPNLDFVIAVYRVFEDSAYSVPSPDYVESPSEFFYAREEVSIIRRDRIVAVFEQNKNEITGTIESQKITGQVSTDTKKIVGEISQPTLSASISTNQKLTGRVGCR